VAIGTLEQLGQGSIRFVTQAQDAMMTNAYVHRGTGLIVQLESDPSGMVVAYVPSLPGCVSQGDTVADALGNIDDAIAGVLAVMREDGTIPR
jgi:predicted RNase H-like HicB family nuclease